MSNVENTAVSTNGVPGESPEQQMLASRLALRSELRLSLRKQSRKIIGVIEDPVRGRYFQVGPREYHFLKLLNGKRTVAEAIELLHKQQGNAAFDVSTAKQVCAWLIQMNLLNTNAMRNGIDRLFSAARGRKTQKLLGLLNPVSFRLELFNPDKLLKWITPMLGWIFSWQVMLVWLACGGIAWSMVMDNYAEFSASATGFLAPDRWLWLLLIWVVLKFVHEAAHGVACKRYGGEVPRCGVLLLLLAPLAFVDVTSSWRMTSSWRRMVVAAAGMYVELFLAFIAVFVWSSSLDTTIRDIAYNVIVMAGISTVLFNANPLIRCDGYYILSDVTGIVNLYSKGQAWLGNRFRHLVFGFPYDDNVCPANEKRLVATYGICSFFWRIFPSASLLLAACTLLGGFGILLAAIGAIFWVAMPIWNSFKRIRLSSRQTPINWRRFSIAATVGVLAAFACFVWIQAPAITSVPAIVQFRDERIMRAATDGFVEEVFVRNGQQVAEGQLLMRLNNPELKQELVDLQRSQQASMVQMRMHRQRKEIALLQSEQTRFDSLTQQIHEKESQLAQMEIIAPLDGVVLARGIENKQGSFVKRGEVLLSCANPGDKKVLLSIDQQQAESVRENLGRPVKILFANSPVLMTKICSVDPRASDVPTELALTAALEGELPVRPVADQNQLSDGAPHYRLITPRFDAECMMPSDAESSFVVGQRGVAQVRGRNLSLGGYFVHCCQKWIRTKLQTANAL